MSEDRVRKFPGVKDPSKKLSEQPRDVVIDVLSDMLDMAEKGELQAVAVIGVLADGDVITDNGIIEPGQLYPLLAGTTMLQHDLVKEIPYVDESEDEED